MADTPLVPADQVLPAKLPIIPLEGKPIFPGIFTPLMLQSKEDAAVVEKALQSDKIIGLVLLKHDEENNLLDPEEFFRIGTAAKIVKKINLPDGGINIFISTMSRFAIKRLHQEGPNKVAVVEYLEDYFDPEKANDIKALTRSLLAEMKQISEDNPLFSEEVRLNMVNIDEPGKIADFITSILNIPREKQQEVLEMLDIRQRMEQVLVHIKKEQELLKIQKKISLQINEKIEKNQREYFLREELKAIKKELGITTDAKGSDYQKFKEIIEGFSFQGEVKRTVEQELEKFSLMDPNSSEFIVTRNYLETIAGLPWPEPEPENVDLAKGKAILDADHYGLEDVKERILEYLAIRKLKNDNKGSIICLLGPPGVGKTSIGQSVARALGREFFRFSVGGMRDEAEIKGHRRTYVGAMPGKIIQGLKITRTKNPVFMIDEIDKLGASYQGDPSSALLEVLDPEQNFSFRDHYLDLPFDISNILFIATANSLDSIPRPLLDRMEVIRLSGYIAEEKIEIAKKYLIPKTLKEAGLLKKHLRYQKSALLAIIGGYAREAGLRNFEKALAKIHRKVAKKVVLEDFGPKEPPFVLTEQNIVDYLGQPIFHPEEDLGLDKPGMVTGLAWTSFGGTTLVIEAVKVPGKGGVKLTGQMGDVMKESAAIAYTYVQTLMEDWEIPEDFFTKYQVHLHIPEGATPKDGPSAGITMASALLSLALNKKVKAKIAMTGELSLTGKVMAIGGLKEKVIAARRIGIKTILFPKSNQRDLEEIPEYIKKGMRFVPADRMNDVLQELF
jgi:ATP-dependent Lon protease